MSPALVKKYLEAARRVADHLVLKPDGFAFAPHPMLADTDRDKYCVNRIIDFYRRQKTDYADYFLAAWRFLHREALGQPDATLDGLAAESGLSPQYLATVWATLDGPAGGGRPDRRDPGDVAGVAGAPGEGDAGRTRRLRADARPRRRAPRQAHAGGQEPAGAGDQQRLAAAGPLEEPPVRREPDAVRRRGAEDPAGGPGRDRARRRGRSTAPTDPEDADAVRGDLRPLLRDLPRRLLSSRSGPGSSSTPRRTRTTPGGC